MTTPTLPPLGPLPEPKHSSDILQGYTAEQMQSYATEYGEQCARAAVEAEQPTDHYPKQVEPYIFQYAEELFVGFDPTDGGSSVVGAWRTQAEARSALTAIERELAATPAVVEARVPDAVSNKCSDLLRELGVPSPRTCQVCGLGPCRWPEPLSAAPAAPGPQAQQTQAAKGGSHGDE